MTAIFVTYNQAYYMEIVDILESHKVRGYTEWDEIKGRGSENGQPHLGSHAWPTLNNAIITFVEDAVVDNILDDLKAKDELTPDLGIRAFSWKIDRNI